MTKYRVRVVRPDVFVVVVPDDYDRGMLFWRAQEFYESPSRRFRGSKFSVWDYAKWYSKRYGGSFSYPADFVGYNLPLAVARKCYELNDLETPYDREMKSLVDSIYDADRKQYIIGAESHKGWIFRHELAHALYYTVAEYRHRMDEATRSLSDATRGRLSKNLSRMWYYKGVIKDEIQAYMSTEVNEEVCVGVRNRARIHKMYKRIFDEYT